MDSNHSETPVPATAKIIIAGGFGAGKTTLVGAITEIRPLRTEEVLSDRSIGVDDINGMDSKTTTTVAMDFGRITFRSDLALYLFGMPGQERFWFMWEEMSYGALGAVVLADTRRLASCFASVDYFEHHGLPFVVAVNCFDGAPRYESADVRIALDLEASVPVLMCDARRRESVKTVLIGLVRHALTTPGTEGRQLGLVTGSRPGSASSRRQFGPTCCRPSSSGAGQTAVISPARTAVLNELWKEVELM